MNIEDLKVGYIVVFDYRTTFAAAYEIIDINVRNEIIIDKLIWGDKEFLIKNIAEHKIGKASTWNWMSEYKGWVEDEDDNKLYMPGKWFRPNKEFDKHRERLLAS